MQNLAISALESFTLLGPDGRIIQRPDLIQFISPAISHGAMNTVVRSRFSKTELDQKIEETLLPYREANLNCWWILGPNSLYHQETEGRLSRLGFSLDHEAFGLVLSTDYEMKTAISPRVSVEKVTEKNLDDYLRAARDGVDPSPSYRSYFSWIMAEHGELFEAFLSRVDGEPAGTGLLLYLGGSASFVSGFVRPKFRGMGAYQALVKFRLERLYSRKIPHAVVLSKANTSAPILLRNGFTKVCEFRAFEKLADE